MSGRAKANAFSIALVLVYVAVSVVMWIVAFQLDKPDEDKSQAAMIGAASAFTVGGAAVVGGWFNAWRTSRLEQAREDKQTRLEAYARLLGALADYGRACTDVREYTKVTTGPPSSADGEKLRALAAEKLVAAQAHARQVLLNLEQAFAAAELVATEAVRGPMVAVKQGIDTAGPGEATIDSSTLATLVAAASKALGYR